MESKIMLPSPSFNKNISSINNQQKTSDTQDSCKLLIPKSKTTSFLHNSKSNFHKPHFSSPNGMLLPSSLQPPPMYGPRGATIPPKFMNNYQKNRNRFSAPQPQSKYDKYNNNKNINQKLWCDVCDQNFSDQTQLDKHTSLHRSCNFENCKFIGIPETLSAHVEQHNNGFFDKIKNLNTPEEIEKWKSERKKNYPTIANVELRRKAREAKMIRGEKLLDSKARFGKSQDRKQMRADNKNCFKTEKQKNLNEVKNKKTSKRKRNTSKHNSAFLNEPKVNLIENNEKKVKFRGTSFLKDYKVEVVKTTNKNNPLSNLLGMYGSNTDEDTDSDTNEKDEEKLEYQEKKYCPPNTISENTNFEKKNIIPIINTLKDISNDNKDDTVSEKEKKDDENTFIDNNLIHIDPSEKQIFDKINPFKGGSLDSDNNALDDDMPEEQPIKREDLTKVSDSDIQTTGLATSDFITQNNESSKKHLRLKPKILKKSVLDYSKLRHLRRQNTVLSKLLEKDIRHERNLLLQCVRHVINNNFFGIGEKKEH